MAGCGDVRQPTDKIITVDVTKRYPKKELILQDIFDVEYIALETNDEFVTRGLVQYIGKDIVIVTNGSGRDGNIFIFDQKGKGIRKINRKGQSHEEYIDATYFTMNEENNEMIIYDLYGQNIFVYDLLGNFKLKFNLDIWGYKGIFDRENLISNHSSGELVNGKMVGARNGFYIVSRKDGSITKEIEIPFEEKKWAVVISPDGRLSPFARNPTLIPHKSNWIVVEISSDTIYSIMPDFSLTPIIARTPAIQFMDPEIFLFLSVTSDRYFFMQTVKKEYNFSTNTGWPRINLAYDRQEGDIFECVVYNNDFLNNKQVIMSFEQRFSAYAVQNTEIAFFNIIEAHELVEAYKNGELKETGRLKEIAAKLGEEDNSVIMLVKYKK